MAQKLHKKVKRILIFAIVSFMILGVGAQFLEARRCRMAFRYCMDEIIAPGNMVWFAYCANGYLFCKKYVE